MVIGDTKVFCNVACQIDLSLYFARKIFSVAGIEPGAAAMKSANRALVHFINLFPDFVVWPLLKGTIRDLTIGSVFLS